MNLSDVQEEVISDLEAAAAFYEQHRDNAGTLRALADRAGHEPNRIYNVVRSLKDQGRVQGLARLKTAFNKAGIKSSMFDDTDLIDKPTTVKKAQPATPAAATKTGPTEEEEQREIEAQVMIELMSSLKKIKDRKRQTHLLGCIKLFFGLNLTV